MNKQFFIEAFKYGIVGIANTLLTLIIIWIMRSVVGTSLVAANATGYTAGFLNSFILNRFWTFKCNNNWKSEFIKFLIAFIICYFIQLAFVLLLKQNTAMKEQYITLLGMVVYTGINFLLNKYVTFKQRKIS